MKFSEKFMSHKFKGNGLKYKVGVCIATGHIVWVHGPSQAGQNDIILARQAFVSFLNDDEMVVADSGYRGEMQHIKTPDLMHFLLRRGELQCISCMILSRDGQLAFQDQADSG